MTTTALLSAGEGTATALGVPGSPPLSYADLRRQVAEAGRALAGFGIGRNDRVAIVLPDGPRMAAAFLAVASVAGAAPLNPRYTSAELGFFLEDLAPKAIVLDVTQRTAIAVARARGIAIITLTPRGDAAGLFGLSGTPAGATDAAAPNADDIALLLHTSGTTSKPKLVPLTHRQLCASARNVAKALKLTASDRGLLVMPLFHIHGLVAGLLAPLGAGGAVFCTAGLDMHAFPGWLTQMQPSWFTAVPTMHQAVLEWARRDPDAARAAQLRLIRSCSAALPPNVAQGLEEAFGAPVIEAYAMTEAAHQMSSNPLPPGTRRFGSVGCAAGPQIAILDAGGSVLPNGETGEVAIRGENVITGYVANPKADAEAFMDGWFRTGDLGHLDADGYLWLDGRLKEMINRGGEKLAPIEIENALLRHSAVAQAAVFAVPHPSLGEEAAAAIVLRDGHAPSVADLQAHLLETLSFPKIPRRIVFRDALPKGPTGKLRRIGLAHLLGMDAPARAVFVAPRTPMEHELAVLWRAALGRDAVGIDDDFFDLGGNSLAALRIAADIARMMDVELPLVQFLRSPTIATQALAVIERQLSALDDGILDVLLAEAESAPA